ncbi:tyrosine-type recombinase/integrase [Amedibacillus sp. YH-ame6]
MEEIKLMIEDIERYKIFLYEEERSKATIDKYIRDIKKFYSFLSEEHFLTKEIVLNYKTYLQTCYKITSINSMLVVLNGFLSFMGLDAYRVKLCKVQRRMFIDEQRELTKKEYFRLLQAAKNSHNERLNLLMQTICTIGIRVSEHQYISVESLNEGKVVINNKGKYREVYLPKKLKIKLLKYCKKNHIQSGAIFVTRNGKTLNRSNIWRMMKNLCIQAEVSKEKVFPHNLRHLFAVTFYSLDKDLVQLASLLGHTNIETTRIYTIQNGFKCVNTMTRMGLTT